MPICQYFLKGKCNRDDCPYSHVNVGRQAVVCEDFLKGYCALGFKVYYANGAIQLRLLNAELKENNVCRNP